ncbi:MAG: hypothetical protein GDA40_12420 [Rhodobacteraceae bacterium]|nr:hypothetical protein [Paracoccaceae bacterium]
MCDRLLTSVVIEDSRWVSADLRQIAHRAVQESLRHFALVFKPLEVVILGCDDRRQLFKPMMLRSPMPKSNGIEPLKHPYVCPYVCPHV